MGGDTPRARPRPRAPRTSDVPNARLEERARVDSLRAVCANEHGSASRDGGRRLLFATDGEVPPRPGSRRNVIGGLDPHVCPRPHWVRCAFTSFAVDERAPHFEECGGGGDGTRHGIALRTVVRRGRRLNDEIATQESGLGSATATPTQVVANPET